jgi:alpha-L-arabinofuranosidase
MMADRLNIMVDPIPFTGSGGTMRKRFLYLGFYICLTWIGDVLAIEDQTLEEKTESAMVVVNLDQSKEISPYLFGQNIEYFDVAQGLCDPQTGSIRADVQKYLSSLRMENLRFPGGTLAQFYHWADGIGPMEKRGKACTDWGEHKPELPMTFGTDEFFRFAESIGFRQTILTVNMQSARCSEPWMGTAQEAAAWVAYCNATSENKTVIGKDCKGRNWGTAADWAKLRAKNGHPEPYGVRFWELGNEVYVSIKDPSLYAQFCCEYARAMRFVDPSIRIGVVAKDPDFGLAESPWNNILLKQTDGLVDYLIAHFYLPGINGFGVCPILAGDETAFHIAIPNSGQVKITVKAYTEDLKDSPKKLIMVLDDETLPKPVWMKKDFPIWEIEKKISAGEHTIRVKNADTGSTVVLHEIYMNGDTWKQNVEFRNISKNDVTRITLVSPDRFRKKMSDFRSAIDHLVTKKYNFGLAITEFACNLKRDEEIDPDRLALIRSQQSAVYLADTLLAFQEANVETSNYWTLKGWQWSLVDLIDNKIVPQAPYYVYKMYTDHWQALFCPTKVTCGTIELSPMRKAEFRQPSHAAFVAGASTDKQKSKVAVMLVNRALEKNTKVTVHVRSNSFSINSARLTLMSAEPYAVNTAATPSVLGLKRDSVTMKSSKAVECVLPPCSVGMLFLEGTDKEGVSQ